MSDLRNGKQADAIANDIVNLAKSMKSSENEVMLSGIVPRRDEFDNKGKEVNKILKTLCYENNYHFIDNENIDKMIHLNNSGLHLNYRGTYAMGANLVKAIKF